MAKTFRDINDNVVEIIDYETSVDTNEDLVSNEISNYFVIVSDYKCEVNEKTFNAVKKYLNK